MTENSDHFANGLTILDVDEVGLPVTVTYWRFETQYRWIAKAVSDGSSRIVASIAPRPRLKMPGRASGKVTFQNACHLVAPMLKAASSSVGLIDWSTPRSDR